MINKYIVPSVGIAEILNPSDGSLIVRGDTLTENTIEFSATEQEIRGGFLGSLLGKIFTSPQLNVTITDALVSLEYLALSCGGNIIEGGDGLSTKEITTTVANEIDVSPAVPKMFLNKTGWGQYTIAGQGDWQPITFSGSKASVSNLPVGTKVCVRICERYDAMRTFTVSSAFIPAQPYLVLTLPLFRARQDKVYNASSKVGEYQIHIPRFQLNGTQSLTLSMDGSATTSLSGSAMVDLSNADTNCESVSGMYATFKEIIYNKNEFDDVKAIAISNSDMDLTVGKAETFQVYALYGGVTSPRLLENSKLTFTSSAVDKATVGANTGLVTGMAAGTSNVNVIVTGKSNLSASAVVTVS